MQILHGQKIGFRCIIFVTNDKIEWSSLISVSVLSSKLRKQSILKSFYLWEQNSLKVSQVQAYTARLWHFLFLQIILSKWSQKYHEEPYKFKLRVSGYFDGEYRKTFSIASNWSKVETSSSWTILRALSCNLLILLLVRRLWNIQTIGQYLNWDSTKGLKKCPSFIERKRFRHFRKST